MFELCLKYFLILSLVARHVTLTCTARLPCCSLLYLPQSHLLFPALAQLRFNLKPAPIHTALEVTVLQNPTSHRKRKRSLLSVESKKTVFERRPLQFPAPRLRACKTDTKSRFPSSEPPTPRGRSASRKRATLHESQVAVSRFLLLLGLK